jgi:hypothetical protein
MAKRLGKAGGPNRGRARLRKMGMGSGKDRVRTHRSQKKGKRG